MSAPRSLLTSALTLVLLLTPALALPATAEAPLDVVGPITDRAEVLGDDTSAIDRAMDDLYAETARQLFVVYVDSFEGLTGQEWAEETARESGLGSEDVLLAVAVDQRAYGYSAPADEYSDEDLQRIDREYILPALRDEDWAGAAVGAAEGLRETAPGSGVPWGLVAIVVAVLIAVAGFAVHRTRRRFDHTHRVRDEHGDPIDPAAILTDEELESSAAGALVGIDDALRTSEQELGYAEAQFGADATTDFRHTLEQGRLRVQEAFALRQRLDDAEPESDAERRRLASQIIAICEEVDATLDARAEEFDRVRDLEHRAPEALAEVEQRLVQVRALVSAAREGWARLQAAHTASAVASVAGNVTQAESLLSAAEEAVGLGRADLDADEPSAAAVHLRTAEAATGQAETLLTSLERLEAELRDDRAAADDLAGSVGSHVRAVEEFVETHRGAVGTAARTRLSEAARLLEQGRSTLGSDPDAARSTLTRAQTLAREAQEAADADVAQWRAEHRRDGEPAADGGSALESMLLGGILVDRDRRLRGPAPAPAYRGSSSRSRTSRPTVRRATRRAPASFGGSTTRGRRGGGGRF